jgi:hypothetical protein
MEAVATTSMEAVAASAMEALATTTMEALATTEDGNDAAPEKKKLLKKRTAKAKSKLAAVTATRPAKAPFDATRVRATR